jgi:hypothetical protein
MIFKKSRASEAPRTAKSGEDGQVVPERREVPPAVTASALDRLVGKLDEVSSELDSLAASVRSTKRRFS